MNHEHNPCYHVWLYDDDKSTLEKLGKCYENRWSAYRRLNRIRIVDGIDGKIILESENDKRMMMTTNA